MDETGAYYTEWSQSEWKTPIEYINTYTNIRWIMEKAREFQNNTYFCFFDYAKAFDYVDHHKLWKILKEMGIPDQANAGDTGSIPGPGKFHMPQSN